MKTEIITIGDELLIGQTINTNAAYIGEKCLEIGIHPTWISTVGDEISAIEDVMRYASTRADLIIVTGGLGPTHDDVTKTALCRAFDYELTVNEKIRNELTDRYESRGRFIQEVVNNQAFLPSNAKLLDNPIGSAQGIVLDTAHAVVVALPGVPVEMKSIVDNGLLPYLKGRFPPSNLLTRKIRTFGLTESELVKKLVNLDKILAKGRLAILPRTTGVELRITVKRETLDLSKATLDEIEALIQENLGEWRVPGETGAVEEGIAKLLIQGGLTVASAESCTGGLIAHKLTNVPGSSAFFQQGIISYSNESKTALLGVPAILIREKGAVSAEVAVEMAKKVRFRAGTDIGISSTGIAGPGGLTPDKPLGLVFVAVSASSGSKVEQHIFSVDRLRNKERFAIAALNLLRKSLLEWI